MPLQLSNENFGVTGFRLLPRGIVNRESYFIEVILELKPCRLDELLIFRIMRNIWKVRRHFGPPQVLQVDVDKPIGLRE